ncbi:MULTISPECIES: ABC transporter ATP-binding protein [Pseudothermotoga]|jgi:branched-chain amino acid transport system ATP-binding protein|uniref:ABC transporter related n=1 Tax=Pseudothermotoga lettingae (strain ATCC BAA-301 / DSM 14385 / NBRC 107922 / TMO) TaxID=416591 RepID=A8F6A4_PSELT|nr:MULTISPECIES: ABC transporter ATP-binding protein [Pseudothermotoga]ABV33688.1 ABC transporter related [Pseudothermotoga lettingae TMO]KUK20331.1 MAG: ABC transporter related [Pseudothermotoga lettingae]MDI3494773.1 branched-chain amino acid transport system ATP-binding protein [Pseudothermotoga sp.]MDK2885370.1 branched-chain amino acid transport system ATP-binding protein [Pseudothermotoga sp.]GLI49394.1 ABC transporter ATP-binding protein [Pseudothermotoga lettingae TMO]
MLRLSNLTAGYDTVPVIFNISLEVAESELVAIVGSNGAGKSTILKTISGLLKPFSGEIEFLGKKIHKLTPHEIVKLGIAHVPEGRHIFGKMTVKDNLLMGAYTIKDEKKIHKLLQDIYDLFPRLKERENQKSETLSGGEQQMLAIARALMADPKLLLVDEMSLGLMPVMVDKVLETLKKINVEKKVAILLVEQKVQEALEIADRGYVIQTGKIVAADSATALLNSELVRKAYLGL